MTNLGANIRRLRRQQDLTQKQLTEKSGATSVAMIETGHRISPTIGTIQAIAGALGVTVADLYKEPTGAGEPAPASDAA